MNPTSDEQMDKIAEKAAEKAQEALIVAAFNLACCAAMFNL